MNRISINVPAKQHQQLKALAALEALLDTRVAEAKSLKKGSCKTVGDVFKDARRTHAGEPLNE